MNNEQSIFKKIKEQLSLRNRYFYWSIFVFLIAILTGINNYYFYSHVDRSSERDVRQLKIILEEQIQYCKKNGMKVDECNNLLELTIINFGKNAYYNDKLTINNVGNLIKIINDFHLDNVDSNLFVVINNKNNATIIGNIYLNNVSMFEQDSSSKIYGKIFGGNQDYSSIGQ